MATKGHALSALAGFFGSDAAKAIGRVLFGEAVKAGKEASLEINKKGAGYADEAIYKLIQLEELSNDEISRLTEFTLWLWEQDKINHTENLKKFILFIATGAQEFETKKTTTGTGKNKKVVEDKGRNTKTEGLFLKTMLRHINHKEMLNFCQANHAFNEPAEGYLRLAKKLFHFGKKHGATAWDNLQKHAENNAPKTGPGSFLSNLKQKAIRFRDSA